MPKKQRNRGVRLDPDNVLKAGAKLKLNSRTEIKFAVEKLRSSFASAEFVYKMMDGARIDKTSAELVAKLLALMTTQY